MGKATGHKHSTGSLPTTALKDGLLEKPKPRGGGLRKEERALLRRLAAWYGGLSKNGPNRFIYLNA